MAVFSMALAGSLSSCDGDPLEGELPAYLQGPPSILLLVCDSLAARHLSIYGCLEETSPHLRARLEDGVLFERALAPTAWTLPSVTSLFTGLSQEQHGLRELGQRLDDDIPTLAEALRAGGYRTAAVVQNPLLHPRSGLDRGFDEYSAQDWGSEHVETVLEQALALWETRPQVDVLPKGNADDHGDQNPGDIQSQQPLFLYVHLVPPHMPYEPPLPHRGKFNAPDHEGAGSILECREVHRAHLQPEDERVQGLVANYRENVHYADALFERVAARVLDAPNQNSILVFTSDHGEAFMEHGLQGHNLSAYEEMIHVPLVFWGPEFARGRRLSGPTQLSDLGSTLLNCANLAGSASAPAEDLQDLSAWDVARSLRPQLLPGAFPRESATPPIFVSSRYKRGLEELSLALVDGSFKWMMHNGQAALYDLSSDPNEQRDCRAEHPKRAARMAAHALELYKQRTPDGLYLDAQSDPALQAAMRSLGYFSGSDGTSDETSGARK